MATVGALEYIFDNINEPVKDLGNAHFSSAFP